MKLLFDRTTRRMVGTIEGSTKGLPSNLISIAAPMLTTPETAYLKADNVTVGTQPLTTAETKVRNAGPEGMPSTGIPTAVDLLSATEAIDNAAGKARARYVTQGLFQQEVYDIKAAESAAYIAASYPADTTPYPLITAQAKAQGLTVKAVADGIIATKAAWLTIAGNIEAARLTGKADIKAATDTAAVEDVLQVALTTLAEV